MHIKKLKERRAQLQEEMSKLLKAAEAEERAMNEDEVQKFGDYEKEIKSIDVTIQAEERARGLMYDEEDVVSGSEERAKDEKEQEKAEERAFDNYLRGKVEERADVTLNMADNGAVVPTSIANKIIEKVTEICPIFADAEHYDVTGTIEIPYYDEESSDIEMDYAEEGEDGESTSGSFKNIKLTGFLGRAVSIVSKSLINNSKFDLVSFVIRRMGVSAARFFEKECLFGTDDKIEGLRGIKLITKSKSETAVTSDELIDLQESIPDEYQADAYWIMNRETRKHIRKLKDGQGNYLLNKDATARWGYTLFGKDVYVSKQMPKMAAGTRAIIYGDMKGLAVKVSEQMNIEVLRETRARKHQIEILGFVEFDAKVQNAEMIAALDMKSAS